MLIEFWCLRNNGWLINRGLLAWLRPTNQANQLKYQLRGPTELSLFVWLTLLHNESNVVAAILRFDKCCVKFGNTAATQEALGGKDVRELTKLVLVGPTTRQLCQMLMDSPDSHTHKERKISHGSHRPNTPQSPCSASSCHTFCLTWQQRWADQSNRCCRQQQYHQRQKQQPGCNMSNIKKH